MDIVIDIQFCVSFENSLYPKEIAILEVEDNFFEHFIISPPCRLEDLSHSEHKQNRYIIGKIHGLEWTSGQCDFESFKKIFRDVSDQVGKIYVRGDNKVNFLKRIVNNEIVNLEKNCKCPSFETMMREYLDTGVCLKHHQLKIRKARMACAVTRAECLKMWLVGNFFK